MGRLFEKVFLNRKHRVLVSGRSTELSSRQLALESDVVILSTPLGAALDICEEVGPLLDETKALMDFCSLKEDIVGKMVASTKAQVVGTHPMFGPHTESLKGQNIILSPGRGSEWLRWIEQEFKEEGAVVSLLDAAEHDRTMAVAQGLTHFITICMGRTLQKLNLSPRDTAPYSTPIFKLKNDLIGRLFAQDPELYSTLVGENRYVDEVLKTFMDSMEEGSRFMLSGDREASLDFLGEIKAFLGDFCDAGLKASNEILKSVV